MACEGIACKYCDKRLTEGFAAHYKKHEVEFTRVKLYKCDKCDESFNSKEALKEHKVSHKATQPQKEQ